MPKLKICTEVKRYSLEFETHFKQVESEPISKYGISVIRGEKNVFWRIKVWDLAIYRSLEIYKKIPADRIESSIGTLTKTAKMSLSGKLGSANNKFFEKDDDNNWLFIKWKDLKYEHTFLPLNGNAILMCKKRARIFRESNLF